MPDEVIQVEEDTVCKGCDYTVIANSVMHFYDDAYYCASCAEEMKRGLWLKSE